MSKSYGNAIYLKDTADVIRPKIRPWSPTPAACGAPTPGEPNDCPVFTLHRAFVARRRRTRSADRLPDGGGSAASTARRSSSTALSGP